MHRTSFVLAAIVAGVLSGAAVVVDPLFAGGVVAVLLAWYLRERPRQAFVFYVFVLFLVPSWVQARFFVGLPPTAIAALIVAPAVIHVGVRSRIVAADWVLILIALISGFGAFTTLSPMYAFGAVLVQWVTAYLIGRRLGWACGDRFVSNVIVIFAGIVGAWAVVEFAFDWHTFINLPGTNGQQGWRNIQDRGGFARSEVAFGHSIILGGVLAMTIPFVFSCTLRFRYLYLVVIGAGVIMSLARGPMIAAVLTLALTIVLAPSAIGKGKRFATAAVAGAALFIAVPRILEIFNQTESDLESSSEYRWQVFSMLPADMRIIGLANYVGVGQDGGTLYRSANSIDSTPLIIGMWWGWIAIAAVTVGMLIVIVRVISRKGGPAEIALVGQLPVLFTVAPITQYGSALWLMAGLAVAAYRPATIPDATGADSEAANSGRALTRQR
jgi:hypothetical protein